MTSIYAYDRDGNKVFCGDRLMEASGTSSTVYEVERIIDEERAGVSFSNRAEHFGNQLGYTSGTEVVNTDDFLVTDDSLRARHTVTFSYKASIALEVDVPSGLDAYQLKTLAFQMAPEAAEDIADQPLDIEVDDSAGLAAKWPGWTVPSEYLNGWMPLEDALH